MALEDVCAARYVSPDEFKALDELTRKLALPAPDGPHNQNNQSQPAKQ